MLSPKRRMLTLNAWARLCRIARTLRFDARPPSKESSLLAHQMVSQTRNNEPTASKPLNAISAFAGRNSVDFGEVHTHCVARLRC